MRKTFISILCSALIVGSIFATEPQAPSAIPATLPEAIPCQSLVPLPAGAAMLIGGEPIKEKAFRWAPDGGWKVLPLAGMSSNGTLQVCPKDEKRLLIVGRGGFVSLDGGTTWQEAFPQYVTLNSSRIQVGTAFWSITRPGTILLQQIAMGKDAAILSLDLTTKEITPWSTSPQFFSRYQRVGDGHFGWLGPTDTIPPSCVKSDDDGKTWKPVPVLETPWALHASAQAQIDRLISPAKRSKTSRMAVNWAFETTGVAFCRFESLVGENPLVSPVFTSTDNGKTWTPVVAGKRTGEIRSLFSDVPFLSKNTEKGTATAKIHCQFDAKYNRVFLGMGGEWFVTTPKDRQWHRLNLSK